MKNRAFKLWGLLDDIDTAGDMFKPSDMKSFQAYYKYINKKCQERFAVFTSDGYDLFSEDGVQLTNSGANTALEPTNTTEPKSNTE